jgi:hypothetical protein
MSLPVAALIMLVTAALSAVVMLIVRRRAPAGTYFKDAVPAGAVYTVAGTGYIVILAFVFFVAFESYHSAKAAAQDEATATQAMFDDAELLSPKARDQLQGGLICYARAVIADEWPVMRQGKSSPVVDARLAALQDGFERVSLRDGKQRAAFDHWFVLNSARGAGREVRISEAAPLVPPIIWLILIVGGGLVIAAVCFFADKEEAALPQVAMIASVAVIVVSSLLLVQFLDKPYENQNGSIKPTAMMRSLALMQSEHQRSSPNAAVPCS